MCDVVVSIDDDLLQRIDRAARKKGVSRTAYLLQVIAKEVGGGGNRREAGSDVHAALQELDELFAGLGPGEDATVAVREERDAR
jgi:hypothetical protein